MLDLAPAAGELSRLLRGISDDQLGDPTPCTDYSLGDLVDHVNGLSLAFAWGAAKTPPPGGPGPSGDAARLEPGWRAQIGDQLEQLALAWKDPGAWRGQTQVGGVDLSGDMAGRFALDELVVHGWDVAAASRQEYRGDRDAVEACFALVTGLVEAGQAGGGLFGPPIPVEADAPMVDRLIGLTGRHPQWTPA